MPPAKNKGLGPASAFAGSQDGDHLADAQDALMSESAALAQQRARERLIRQAEQMGLTITDSTELQAQIEKLQAELDSILAEQSTGASIVSLSNNTIQFTRVGAMVNGLSGEDWAIVMTQLKAIQQAFAWVVGDMLVYATAQKWGEIDSIYQQASEVLEVPVGTLQNWASVARNVEISRRRENLSLSHHIEVRGLSPEWQVFLLEQAEARKLSKIQLRQVVTMLSTGGDVNALLDQVQAMKQKPSRMDALRQSQVGARAQVIAMLAKKKSRKERDEWLAYVREQATEWARLADELKGK